MNNQNKFQLNPARLSRHAHNPSAGYTYTQSTGHIIPTYFDILGPGDSVYFSTKMFTRLQDVATAFLGQIDIHVDYFFVPLQMLYLPFGQIYAQTDDIVSSNFNITRNSDAFPVFNLLPVDFNPIDFSSPDVHLETAGKELARLYDALDLNPLCVLNEEVFADFDPLLPHIAFDYTKTPVCTPWALFAYQAIYQKYYRNDDLEIFDVSAYNIDRYFLSNTIYRVLPKHCRLRYHQRYPDYFTSVHSSPLYSAVNSGLQGSDTNHNDGGVANNLLNHVVDYLNGSTDRTPDVGLTYSNVDTSLGNPDIDFANNKASVVYPVNRYSAQNIRTLFAVDKFLRVYGRAGKTYDDQVLAHFGYKIPHDVKHDLTHICHYRYSITSDPIFATSSSEGSELGQVGGQASGSLVTDRKSFKAPVHGVFMCCVYALTKPRYQNTFSKLHLLTKRLDFPIPEFDKLGVQPLWAFEADPRYFSTQDTAYERIGWQRRYAQFKQRYNRISLAFATQQLDGGGDAITPNTNVYSPWVLSRSPFGNPLGTVSELGAERLLYTEYFLEPPQALNNIMVVPFEFGWSTDYFANPHLMFQTDPLIMEYYCDVKKVSWMSETGEPDL